MVIDRDKEIREAMALEEQLKLDPLLPEIDVNFLPVHFERRSESGVPNSLSDEYSPHDKEMYPFDFWDCDKKGLASLTQASSVVNQRPCTDYLSLFGTLGYTEVRKQPDRAEPKKVCANCGSISTPSWRRCPDGKQLLCNACGLYQKLHNKPRPFFVLDDGSVKVQRHPTIESNICMNCCTTDTPLWRRGLNGQSLCNACGLYYKQHKTCRPVHSKKRQRRASEPEIRDSQWTFRV